MELLFSPGPVPDDYSLSVCFSHRSRDFAALFAQCQDHLKRMTGKEIVFIQGSGSAAIEAVIYSVELQGKLFGVWKPNGHFASRALSLIAGRTMGKERYVYNVEHLNDQFGAIYAVQYETGDSQYNDLTELAATCRSNGILLIVDAVSAFPFYKLPDAQIVILSSSKQLRGLPVMGIVAYNVDGLFRHSHTDYLDIAQHISKAKVGQTPHTALWPQLHSLNESLQHKRWQAAVEAIPYNSSIIERALHQRVKCYGAGTPVLTVESKNVDGLVDFMLKNDIEVYYNKQYMVNKFQISNFNYANSAFYERLAERLETAWRLNLL